jgi:hypothetical protein
MCNSPLHAALHGPRSFVAAISAAIVISVARQSGLAQDRDAIDRRRGRERDPAQLPRRRNGDPVPSCTGTPRTATCGCR